MKNIFFAFFLFFASFAYSAQLDTSNLTDAQVAELKAQAANLAAQNAKGEGVSKDSIAEFVSTWGTQAAAAAEGFAKAFGIAASELNVTVNDFFKTDVGKLTAVVIIWKMLGESITAIIFGTSVLIVGLTFARVLYIRLFTAEEVRLPYNRFWGLWSGEKLVRRKKTFADLDNEGEWMMVWVIVAVIVATLFVSGSIFI